MWNLTRFPAVAYHVDHVPPPTISKRQKANRFFSGCCGGSWGQGPALLCPRKSNGSAKHQRMPHIWATGVGSIASWTHPGPTLNPPLTCPGPTLDPSLDPPWTHPGSAAGSHSALSQRCKSDPDLVRSVRDGSEENNAKLVFHLQT